MLHYMFLTGCISSCIRQTDNIKNVNVLNNLFEKVLILCLLFFPRSLHVDHTQKLIKTSNVTTYL